MDFPIPSHLREFMIPMEGENNCEFQVTGTIRCSCGSEVFSAAESNEGLLAKLSCPDCGREIELLDAGKHGWNGYVCHFDPLDRTQQLWKAVCEECRGEQFRVKVWISSQGKIDFLAECVAHDSAFREDEWTDAFEWIQVSLECVRCGMEFDNWLDYEAM